MLKLKCMKFRKTKENLPFLILSLAIVCLIFGIVIKQAGLFAVATSVNGEAVFDQSNHHITIYDGDNQITVRSDAATVHEALIRADVELGENDTVEPALDEQIVEDNFNINIYRARQVMVLDGYSLKYVNTAATDPVKVAIDAGVELLDADVVKVEPYNNLLESGMTAVYKVHRAKNIRINFFGKQISMRTQAKTIADFLAEREIDTNPDVNWVSLALNTKITDEMSFNIFYQGKQTVVVDEAIHFSEKSTYDFSLDYGKREIIKPGQDGARTVTYEIEMKDGKELSRKVISSIITKQPVTQEIKLGMKLDLPAGTHEDWMATVGIAPSDYGYVNYIITRESHWNPLSQNTHSGAYGLCQALPGKKMESAGSDWQTNPITQLSWCNGYAVGRYGSWAKAYEFWVKNHWW